MTNRSFAAYTITADNCFQVNDSTPALAGQVPAESTSALIVAPQGTRALQASSGGSIRGTNAIDLQISNISPSQIASGIYSVISGGQHNNGFKNYTTIGGGQGNSATNSYATIGGGYYNNASNPYATIAGRDANSASNLYATIGGGYYNNASASYTTIGGGYYNSAPDPYSTVCGGYYNAAFGNGSVIAGGGYDGTTFAGNSINADASFIGGRGINNTIGGILFRGWWK